MSRKNRLYDALSAALTPDLLLIDDESHRHHVPAGAETHFKIEIVSSHFDNLNRVARHRLVNGLLAEEFKTGLHALSLHLFTPKEHQQRLSPTPVSPACRDGKRHDR